MPSRRGAGAALTVLAAAALLSSGCGGLSASTSLRSRLLSVADLPAGWSAAPTNVKTGLTNAPCLSGLSAHPVGWSYAVAAFVQGSSNPSLAEIVAHGSQAQAAWRRFERALARCRTATLVLGGRKFAATVHALPFPRVGSTSSAYAWAFTIAGIKIGFDIVLFDVGSYAGWVSYADLGPPEVATVKAYATAAAAKVAKGSTTRVPDTVSIASAPVRTAHTRLGDVAYRTVGSGTPLVLITGYSGTMEGWDRRFVDALARRYRVVVFDNAGVGSTGAPPARLGIDAMANQTAALIDTLRLRRPNVLGWSMGSMIAQALAVLHPSRVRRLVLCAGFPGTDAVRPSQAAIDSFESGHPQRVMAQLFPADQGVARNTYLAALSSYPKAAPVPASTLAAQRHAVDAWWGGRDPAGRRTADIAAPTLIADGTVDRLDPVANSRRLARLIDGAGLTLYPDAGHAFLFQEQTAFVPLIESFLG